MYSEDFWILNNSDQIAELNNIKKHYVVYLYRLPTNGKLASQWMIKEKRKHILVTGHHRSGTTWVGRTIAHHKDVELVYEPFNPDFVRYNFEYKFDYWFENAPTSPKKENIKKAFDDYLPQNFIQYSAKICRESGYSLKTPLIFLKYLMLSHRRPRFLLKDPIALLSAGWLYERYDLKVICTSRHPLAFAGSLKKQNWDFDFKNFYNQNKLMNGLFKPFREDVERVLDESDFIDRIALLWNMLNYVILHYQNKYPEWHFVKHEQIALEPVSQFKKIYDFLGLDFSREIQEYVNLYTSGKNPVSANSNRYQPRNAQKTLNTWRKRLTEEEAERIVNATEKICSELYEEQLDFYYI